MRSIVDSHQPGVAEDALEEVLGQLPHDLAPDARLVGLGLDSLRAVELCAALARRGVAVSVEDLLAGMTWAELRDPAVVPVVPVTVPDDDPDPDPGGPTTTT